MAFEIDHAIAYKLRNTSGVSTIVGTRIHPLHLPEKAVLPAITYMEISLTGIPTHDESPSGALVQSRFQIDAWTGTRETGINLAKAIFTCLHGFYGTITSGPNSLVIMSCLRQNRRSNYDAETKLYWTSQDFMLFYRE